MTTTHEQDGRVVLCQHRTGEPFSSWRAVDCRAVESLGIVAGNEVRSLVLLRDLLDAEEKAERYRLAALQKTAALQSAEAERDALRESVLALVDLWEEKRIDTRSLVRQLKQATELRAIVGEGGAG